MTNIRFSVSLIALLLMPSVTSAQAIGGQVIDRESRVPVNNSPVELRDSTGAVSSARTDATGTYYLFAPRPGWYQLRVGAAGPAQVVVDSIHLASEEFVQRSFAVPIIPVYFEFQVDSQATQIRGSGSALRYPPNLRDAHVQGEVLVQFVVDSSGRAVVETLKVLRSSHAEFTEAVRQALSTFRYNPARRRGRFVAQLVQQPFTFSVTP